MLESSVLLIFQGALLQVVDAVSRAKVDPQLRNARPDGFGVARIAADEAFDPGQDLRPASQVAKTLKPTDEPLCLADLNHAPTVAPWLRQRNAALLAPIKGNTAFERLPSPGRQELRS